MQTRTSSRDVFPGCFRRGYRIIYQQYLKAFKKGVYNYIKEEQDPLTHRESLESIFQAGGRSD